MDVIIRLFSKIFIFILIGHLLGRIKVKDFRKVIDVIINTIIYFLAPCFILVVMWESNISMNLARDIVLVALVTIAIGGVFALVLSRLFSIEFREVCLPVMFMNSAFIAIPLNTVLFGSEGGACAIVYGTTVSIVHFTLGVFLVSRGNGFKALLKLPIIYAAVLGFTLNYFQLGIPAGLASTTHLLKQVTIPLMLALVGFRVRFKNTGLFKIAFVGTLFRFTAGFISAIIMIKLLSMSGVSAKVAMVTSIMPSAVIAYVLSSKYDSNPDFASTMIFMSTLASILIILGVSVAFL